MPDDAPLIPGPFGVDDDPETADDSIARNVEGDDPDVYAPPAGDDASEGDDR